MDGAAGYASPRRDGRGAIGIRQDCRLCQPPCQRGEELAKPAEGGIRPPSLAFPPRQGIRLEAWAELGEESLHRLRRSPSLWQGRLATEGAAS